MMVLDDLGFDLWMMMVHAWSVVVVLDDDGLIVDGGLGCV